MIRTRKGDFAKYLCNGLDGKHHLTNLFRATKWLDFDWETGLGYYGVCGWDPDNDLLTSDSEASA
jgi:hypothetical protein